MLLIPELFAQWFLCLLEFERPYTFAVHSMKLHIDSVHVVGVIYSQACAWWRYSVRLDCIHQKKHQLVCDILCIGYLLNARYFVIASPSLPPFPAQRCIHDYAPTTKHLPDSGCAATPTPVCLVDSSHPLNNICVVSVMRGHDPGR